MYMWTFATAQKMKKVTEWSIVKPVEWVFHACNIYCSILSTPSDVTLRLLTSYIIWLWARIKIHIFRSFHLYTRNCSKLRKIHSGQGHTSLPNDFSSEFILIKPFVFLSFIFESSDRYKISNSLWTGPHVIQTTKFEESRSIILSMERKICINPLIKNAYP